jgi:hypothetical protein
MKLIYFLKFYWYTDDKRWAFDRLEVGEEEDLRYGIRVDEMVDV